MSKNLVVCFDGTGNQFGSNNSNVVKLYQTLQNSGNQIGYYHPGVGTMGAPGAWSKLSSAWTKLLGKAIGYGVADGIADAYRFLMDNFAPEDRLYIFGFSRGAYMARALASLLYMYGLASKGNYAVIPYITRMLSQSSKDRFAVAGSFKQTFSQVCVPHFIGVWDTVSSVGMLYNPIRIPYTHNYPPPVIGRHAISIDECRVFFRQNLWQQNPGQDIKQVWFAGVHSDVGGGYAEAESQLAKLALQWMLQEAEAAGLQVDAQQKYDVLGLSPGSSSARPDACGLLHKSLHGFWYLATLVPRVVAFQKHLPNGKNEYHHRVVFGAGRAREILDGANVHVSVRDRLQCKNVTYRPANLPKTINYVS